MRPLRHPLVLTLLARIVRASSALIRAALVGLMLSMMRIPAASAVEHTRPQGEPHSLLGKRLVFTNWFFVRVGQLDWADSNGKSTFGSNTVRAGPWDETFRSFLLPHGI